jgi:hypothetical protein
MMIDVILSFFIRPQLLHWVTKMQPYDATAGPSIRSIDDVTFKLTRLVGSIEVVDLKGSM